MGDALDDSLTFDLRRASSISAVRAARRAFAGHDIVLIDTPGSAMVEGTARESLLTLLAECGIDELHAVLPLGMADRELAHVLDPPGRSRREPAARHEARRDALLRRAPDARRDLAAAARLPLERPAHQRRVRRGRRGIHLRPDPADLGLLGPSRMSTPPNNEPVDQRTGVEAIIEPIKAVGALARLRRSASWRAIARAPISPARCCTGWSARCCCCGIAWLGAVWLVREMMISHVQEQRRLYEARVEEALQAKAAREQARATPLPPPVPRVTLGPGGRS